MTTEMQRRTITVGERALKVAVAATAVQWATGMAAVGLDDVDGMLFVMGGVKAQFHMAGIAFPILIAFFDHSGQFLSAEAMEPGTGRSSPGEFTYALELTALDPTIVVDLAAGLHLS